MEKNGGYALATVNTRSKTALTPRLNMNLRKATPEDVPLLTALIDASVRGLQAQDYTPEQIDLALKHVYGVDSQLIADGTYFVVEDLVQDVVEDAVKDGAARTPDGAGHYIVGCGGWSRRKTLYGGDVYGHREDELLLDPACDAAKIRAFFVHPAWARRGIGSMLLATCERAATADGFTRFEMGSTLTGVALYQTKGYVALEALDIPMPGGAKLPVVRMGKTLPR